MNAASCVSYMRVHFYTGECITVYFAGVDVIMMHPLTNWFPWQLISLFTEKLRAHWCSRLNRFTPPATSSIIPLLLCHKCEKLTPVRLG